MKDYIVFVVFCIALSANYSFGTEVAQGANEVQLAKETMQQLREGYKDYLDAAKNLHAAVEQAKSEIPLLGPTEEAFKSNEEFRHRTLTKEREKYWQYLKNSNDPNETKIIFYKLRSRFGVREWANALEDPNQERVLKLPMLTTFRVLMSKPDQRKSFEESLKKREALTFFDVNEPNDDILWQNLKQMYLERAEMLEAQRQQIIDEMGVPEWLANYAGREDFAQGAFENYEGGLILLTPETVRQAEIRLLKASHKLSNIYPEWFRMHHLLDEKYPANEDVIKNAQEHLQAWPVERTISPSELRD